MAKQHIYTRGKRGLFTHAEGYDTIAVSKGLTEEYIKKNIYPLCFYEKHGFNDEDDIMPDVYYYKYIKSPENNEAVIFGKNSYVYSSRNYILCESIIIYDKSELYIVYNNFDKYIEFNDYPIKPDNPIILDDINLNEHIKYYDIFMERDFIFRLLSIDEKKFKYFLSNIIWCLERKETIFIKLRCGRKYCSRYAKKLIKLIFINLPNNLKKKISYMTYSPSVNIKSFFNIVFLDDEAEINLKDIGVYFDFFEETKFTGKDYFLDFSWKNIVFANKIIYKNYLDKLDCLEIDILDNLNKASTQLVLSYKNKFDCIDENFIFSLDEYIDNINLFFDIKFFYKKESIKWIKKLKVIHNNIELKSYKYKLDDINFLIMKTPYDNKSAFLNIINEYYNLNFDNYFEDIVNEIARIYDFEDFIITSFFYINYTFKLIKEKNNVILNDIINQKLIYFQKKLNIKGKEPLDDLSIYLWKRYIQWI